MTDLIAGYTDTLYKLIANGADQMQIDLFVNGLTAEQAALVAIHARQKRLELEKEFEQMVTPLKGATAAIEARFLSEMNQSGETNKSGANWRATRSETNNASMPDSAAFYTWLEQTHRFDMLQKRLSSKTIVEYLDETSTLPPGVALNKTYGVTFYRK